MRRHPYIFKYRKDGKIFYFQGTVKGIKVIKPDRVLDIRLNLKFNGKHNSIKEYFRSLKRATLTEIFKKK